MKKTRKGITRWVLVLLGIILGIECLGSKRDPFYIKIKTVEMAIAEYRVREGLWPSSLEELTLSIDGRHPFLYKETTIDSWGEPFGFECGGPEDSCIVWSTGPDRKLGTADDIVEGHPMMVARWREKHGLPVDTNALQRAMSRPSPESPEEQERRLEAAQREAEYIAQQVAEDRERTRQASRKYVKRIASVAAAILCFYAALPFLLKRFKRGVVRRALIALAIVLWIVVARWCAEHAHVVWQVYSRQKSHYGHVSISSFLAPIGTILLGVSILILGAVETWWCFRKRKRE